MDHRYPFEIVIKNINFIEFHLFEAFNSGILRINASFIVFKKIFIYVFHACI